MRVGGLGREDQGWAGRGACCGDMRVVLVFWIFYILIVNFVYCYGF